jgi:hypothetical protein
MIRRWFKKSELEVRGGTVVGKATPDEPEGWIKAELVALPGHPLPPGPEDVDASGAVTAKAVVVTFHCPHCRGEVLLPEST